MDKILRKSITYLVKGQGMNEKFNETKKNTSLSINKNAGFNSFHFKFECKRKTPPVCTRV